MSKKIRNNKKKLLSVEKMIEILDVDPAVHTAYKSSFHESRFYSLTARYGEVPSIIIKGKDRWIYHVLPKKKKVIWASEKKYRWNEGIAQYLTRKIFR